MGPQRLVQRCVPAAGSQLMAHNLAVQTDASVEGQPVQHPSPA